MRIIWYVGYGVNCCACEGPSSQYVVSLRAFNNVGEGIPVYETTVTRDDSCTQPNSALSAKCLCRLSSVSTVSDTKI